MRGLGSAAAVVSALVIGFIAGAAASGARDQRKVLMETDRDFDLATANNGAEGWTSYFAEDGIMMPAGGEIVAGKKAIRELMESRLATPGYSLRWEPIDADVSGDLGYTYGVAKFSRTGKDGKPEVSYGKYVTIWKKQRDRSWKVAVDIGNSSPPPKRSR